MEAIIEELIVNTKKLAIIMAIMTRGIEAIQIAFIAMVELYKFKKACEIDIKRYITNVAKVLQELINMVTSKTILNDRKLINCPLLKYVRLVNVSILNCFNENLNDRCLELCHQQVLADIKELTDSGASQSDSSTFSNLLKRHLLVVFRSACSESQNVSNLIAR